MVEHLKRITTHLQRNTFNTSKRSGAVKLYLLNLLKSKVCIVMQNKSLQGKACAWLSVSPSLLHVATNFKHMNKPCIRKGNYDKVQSKGK